MSAKQVHGDPIHVFLIDDDDDFRQSCRWILEQSGFSVADFAGAAAALDALQAEPPPPRSCVVSDIRMPDINGMQLQEKLVRTGRSLPLIFITGHGDVALAVEAMRNGAANFIEKPFEAAQLIAAIDAAVSAHMPEVAEDMLRKLTPREREVLDRIMNGKLNKVIADELQISQKTVEFHRANLMLKLGVHNIVELTRLVLGHA